MPDNGYVITSDDKWASTADDTWYLISGITVETATATVTFQVGRLNWHHSLRAGQTALSVTLQDALFDHVHARRLICEHATVAVTGQSAGLALGEKLLAENASIEISLQAADLSMAFTFWQPSSDEIRRIPGYHRRLVQLLRRPEKLATFSAPRSAN